jgi:hypothetical protein
MLMRYRDFAAAGVITLASSAAAMAGWNDWWHGVKTDYHRSTDWPYPFVCADRMAQQAPLTVMVDNGWRRENTLDAMMFDNEGNLTSAGVYKVKWIITQAPHSRRTVWVLRADTDDMTNQRKDSVQTLARNILPEGTLPEVLINDRPPGGMSGDYLDAIDRSMRSTVPAPRLPAMPTDAE